MDAREQRGLEIVEKFGANIVQRDGTWLVPSQSDKGNYLVTLDNDSLRCTCPDFDLRGTACKHIYAAAIVVLRISLDVDHPFRSKLITRFGGR